MINIKQNISCLATKAYTKTIPNFKNPNNLLVAALPKQTSITNTVKEKGYCAAAIAGHINGSGLVFLKKKGSINANTNIIGYNFPATAKGSCLKKSALNRINFDSFIINNVYKLLFSFFKSMYCLISKPVFITTPDKIKIQLFYFLVIPKILIDSNSTSPNKIKNSSLMNWVYKDLKVQTKFKKLAQSNLTKVYPNKFKLICSILSKFFKKPVELDLIRLHQPYYDSNILVNFLALIINKNNISACIHKLFDNNIVQMPMAFAQLKWIVAFAVGGKGPFAVQADPNISLIQSAAYLSGLNIKISGRLMREPILPRITTKNFEKGSTAIGKINYSDKARFTHRNRKGAFTITIKSGQNF